MRFFLAILVLFIVSVPSEMKAQKLTDEQKQEILERHNYYRSEVGVSPLQWSDSLAGVAQKWANKIAKWDKLVHSNYDYGENLYVSTNKVSASRPVDAWASEKKFYHNENIANENVHLFGHYTQIIWAKTTKVGCAEAVSKKGNHYWVCEYAPTGNMLGEKPVNK